MLTKEISPKIRFEPLLIMMATPRLHSTTSGSIQELVLSSSTRSTNSTANTVIMRISFTVLVVATAVDTAAPVMAFSSPMMARRSSTACRRLSSSMVSVNSAQPSQ